MERTLISLPHEIIGELAALLGDAITHAGANKGMVHVYDKQRGILTTVTSKGFSPEYVAHFRTVKPFDSSACGRAAGIRSVIFIPDISQDLAYQPHLSVTLRDDVRAVKAIPLHERSRFVGVLSVHFSRPQPKRPGTDTTDLPTNQMASLLYEIIKLKESN